MANLSVALIKFLAIAFVAAVAAWLPVFILFPIGLILTFKAMNDSKLLDVDKYFSFIRRLFLGKEI